MKNGKRILSVTIKRMFDEDPDTSWLGEYSMKSTSDYSIDRAHSLDCIENDPVQKQKLVRIADAIENDRPVCHEHMTWTEEDCEVCAEEKAYTNAMENISELLECDCGERGDQCRNEYRFFNPSFNYVNKYGNPLPDNTPEEVCKYVRQDYERMEDLHRGHWTFIGIRAEASVSLPVQCNQGCVKGREVYYHVTDEISSGGLWGIESDSEESYLESVEKDELANLREQLKALGFSSRAISTAFKSIERKED